LSGDVHHGYLAEAEFRDGVVRSLIYQAVCSPLRNSLPGQKSRLQSVCWAKPGELAGRLLSRMSGIGKERMSWRMTHSEPWFENHVATLEIGGRQATVTFEKAITEGSGEPSLQGIYERRLV
ncbi:MAG TPA: alkaline phosphatase family protein, partial [Rubrobacteraceae bacterium]|nr:alkaline phosphatase family protein [Rubrobacteraceae bacterium]